MSPKSTLHRLKMTLTLSFLALFALAASASAGVSPPFASVETSSGLSIVYKSSTDQSLWTTGSTNGSAWPTPTQLPTHIGTNFAPTAVVWNGFTHVIYGSLADNTLWMTDSSNWSALSHLPADIKTYTTPSAVVFQSKLFLVYKSTEDATLWAASSNDGLTWELNHLPTTITTSASPATAVWNSRLYTFYRSAMDGTIWYSSSSNGKAWDRPSQVSLPPSLTTSAPPAVTVWDNELYVVFRSSSDQTIWVSNSSDGFTWNLSQIPTTATTSAAPTASVLNNQLYVLYKSSTDHTIWQVRSVDGVTWTSPFHLPTIITTQGGTRGWNKIANYGGLWSIPGLPGAAIDDQKNLLFTWTDNAHNLKLLYPSGGSIPVTLNGGAQGSPSSVYANGSFYVFWRASATGQLHFGILNDPNNLAQGFKSTQALGGAFSTDGPQVTLAGGPGQPLTEQVIYVAWRGVGGDPQLYSGYLSNLAGTPAWSGVSLFVTTGAFNSTFSPAVGANQAGTMYTVWKGEAPSDLRLFFARNLDFAYSSYQPGSTLNSANGTQLQTDDRPSLGVIRSGPSTGSLVATYTLAGGMYYTINDYSGSTLGSCTNQAQIPTPGLPNPEGLLITNPTQAGSSLYLLVGDRDGNGLMVNALYLYEFLTD